MYTRNLLPILRHRLKADSIVQINGAHQVGKTTLIQESLLSPHPGFGVLDDVQGTPQIWRDLKALINTPSKRPSLLASSIDVLALSQIKSHRRPPLSPDFIETIPTHTLWPLSQGELVGSKESFMDRIFRGAFLPVAATLMQHEWIHKWVVGGYPSSLRARTHDERSQWFGTYLRTLLETDIKDITRIQSLTFVIDVLRAIASETGQVMNMAEISRITGLSVPMCKRYHTLLKIMFMVVDLPAWFLPNKGLSRSSKTYINDTGLLCYLLGIDETKIEHSPFLQGRLLENFVIMELIKQRGWSMEGVRLFHGRTLSGYAIDILLEAPDGRIIGIDIQNKTTLSDSDWNGLRKFQDIAGDRFVKGIILYRHSQNQPYEKNMIALPLEALWCY